MVVVVVMVVFWSRVSSMGRGGWLAVFVGGSDDGADGVR